MEIGKWGNGDDGNICRPFPNSSDRTKVVLKIQRVKEHNSNTLMPQMAEKWLILSSGKRENRLGEDDLCVLGQLDLLCQSGDTLLSIR